MVKGADGHRRRWWVTTLKVLALTVLAAVLFAGGMLTFTVSLLTPQRLTPLVNHYGTRLLRDCELHAARVELQVQSTYPFFNVTVDSLTLISTAMRRLPAAMRAPGQVPAYADTLLHFDRFSGGIHLPELALGRLRLSDVTLTGPTANIVVVNDTLNNYSITEPSDEPSEPLDLTALPDIQLQRVSVLRPGPLRYLDATTATEVTALLDDVILDATGAPTYRLTFNADVNSPTLLEYLTLDNLRVGLNGDVEWSQAHPYAVGVRDFTVSAGPVAARFNAAVDMAGDLTVNSFGMTLEPIRFSDVVELLPPSAGVPADIRTDMQVQSSVRLLEPFRAAEDLLPHVEARILIPDASLRWRRVDLRNIGAEVIVTVPTDYLDDIKVELKRLNMRGPATDLNVAAQATNLTTDPRFNASLLGRCNLNNLPPQLLRLLPGTLTGVLTADADVSGRMSMLTPRNFTRLNVTGKLSLDGARWESADTVTRAFVNRMTFDFGTDRHFTDSLGNRSRRTLATKLTVDSARISHDVLRMTVRDFGIGLAAENAGRYRADTTVVIPMGGGVRIGAFDLLSLSDSARVRVRDARGMAAIASHGNERVPEFNVNLEIGSVMAGDRSTRLSLRQAHTSLTAWPRPRRQRRRPPQGGNRPRMELTADSTELIDFTADKTLVRLVNGWNFDGELTARRANLFTPYFPLRNRLSEVDVTFNNDSVNIRGMRYRAGRSDFAMHGHITNLRRAVTRASARQPLHVHLHLASDTLDVNQLAAAAFAASAYAEASDSLRQAVSLGDGDDDEAMDRAIEGSVATAKPQTGFLVPQNIDAVLELQADNIIYSDLLLHGFTGTLQAHAGALSIDNLHAASDVGAVNMSALYMGRDPADLSFGFGLQLDRFNIERFLKLMPAIDSLMPMMQNFAGIINADIAATSKVTRAMDLDIPSLDAAITITGDSLVLIDPETFRTMSKWLFFKNKERNIIDHMEVQMLVSDNTMRMYPFMFNIDRYRLGVQGHNDFALNFDYHVAVLKSPLPFRFGINIKGNPDDFKIRVGRAKFNDKTPATTQLVDTVRVSLIKEIKDVFRRGIRQGDGRIPRMRMPRGPVGDTSDSDTLPADSLQLIDSLIYNDRHIHATDDHPGPASR